MTSKEAIAVVKWDMVVALNTLLVVDKDRENG